MKKVCTTPIHLEITEEGLTEEGAPIMAVTKDLKCNYQDVAKEILTAQKKIVQITGSAYFQGDIAPGSCSNNWWHSDSKWRDAQHSIRNEGTQP